MKYIKKTIEQCAEVIPGVLDQKGSGSEYLLYDAVLPNQITSSGFINEYGKVQRAGIDKAFFLQVGDILIKRLNPDCAVVFKDEAVQALPSANLFVIRPCKDQLDSYYLAAIMESSNAFGRLSQRSGIGSAVSAVTVSQIRNYEIPLPSLEEQRKIGELWKCSKKRNNLLQNLISENNRLLRSISEKLYQ